MKISYEWLKSYLPGLLLPPEELARRILLAGFPVESIAKTADGDPVLDIEVTSNRPDLLGHLGVAREFSALTGVPFVPPPVHPAGPVSEAAAKMTSVKLEAPAACPHYTARIIQNVKVAPSPAWLIRRIEAVGLRPVNNVVDITNYVLFEFSQPLHAFDHRKLDGGRIVVRMARPGEKITSIDGHVRDLDPSMLVIADAARPVAVAGVMGGLDSEVGPSTTTVLLESAYFDPLSIRATARKLGLFSDSSFRFERGVDPGGIEAASNRAADLIVELAGGVALPGLVVDPASRGALGPQHTPTVTLRLARMRQLLGIDVDAGRVVKILAGLQLSPRPDGDQVTVSVPSYRQDLRREVDLIEEVARIEGYDRIPVHEKIEVVIKPPNFRLAATRRIARALCAQGFFETISITFLPPDKAELFARPQGQPGHLEVVHSSRKQENALRRSLLPSLLAARRHNETVQTGRADLFEIAAVFDPPAPGQPLPAQSQRLGLCTDGDFRQCRGVLEELVRQFSRAAELTLASADRAEFVPGQAASVLLNGAQIGLIGRPTPELSSRFELRQEVTVAEIDVEPLLALAGEAKLAAPLSRYPAIARDVSILVDEAATWQQVQQTIRDSSPQGQPAALEELEFVDLFRGKQLPAGKKSFTFTLRYRLADATLTNEQANAFVARTVEALTARLGAALRDK